MKKYLLIIIILLFLFVFIPKQNPTIENKKGTNEEKKAIFLSYIELQKYIKGKTNSESQKNIDQIINHLDDFHFNMLILQVRSFSDAIYESKLYPWSSTISSSEGISPGYDILDYFVEKAHEKHIEVHAWINPYRIRNTNDTSTISKDNKAYEWLDTNHVKVCDKGIFYNPASEEVQNLIVEGIQEIVDNYDVDGIHFDDYFYPVSDIDLNNYQEYLKTHDFISLENYHLLMVNQLIKRVHQVTKKKKILFGVSPEGNIDNNYSTNFADVYEWGKSDDYVDYLMPQIYYGFFNESQPFYDVVKSWNDLVKESHVKIIPALAFYKTGVIDTYAKSGSNEWVENNNIIMRQILVSRNMESYDGFAIFRYDSIFNTESQTDTTMNEIKNLKKVMEN